jgi:hypothetical protein
VLAHRAAPYSLSNALDERFGDTRVLAVTTLYGVLVSWINNSENHIYLSVPLASDMEVSFGVPFPNTMPALVERYHQAYRHKRDNNAPQPVQSEHDDPISIVNRITQRRMLGWFVNNQMQRNGSGRGLINYLHEVKMTTKTLVRTVYGPGEFRPSTPRTLTSTSKKMEFFFLSCHWRSRSSAGTALNLQ